MDLGCLTSALSKRLLVSRCAAMIMGMWTLELFSPNPAVRSIDRVEFQQGLSLAVAVRPLEHSCRCRCLHLLLLLLLLLPSLLRLRESPQANAVTWGLVCGCW